MAEQLSADHAEHLKKMNAIRAQIAAINRLYGGKYNIEEWVTSDGYHLKAVLTFKFDGVERK